MEARERERDGGHRGSLSKRSVGETRDRETGKIGEREAVRDTGNVRDERETRTE